MLTVHPNILLKYGIQAGDNICTFDQNKSQYLARFSDGLNIDKKISILAEYNFNIFMSSFWQD